MKRVHAQAPEIHFAPLAVHVYPRVAVPPERDIASRPSEVSPSEEALENPAEPHFRPQMPF